MFTKVLATILKHKFIAGFVILGLVIGSYFTFKDGGATQVKYVFAAVEKGTIVTSITGSGQVSVSDQVDGKPKVSGDVIYVGVKNGQEVRAGALIAQLDTKNAQKVIRDAEINLENSQISLSKLQISQGADAPKLEDAITTAQNNLNQAYQNGFNSAANAFLDLPDILAGIHGILYDSKVSGGGQSNTGAYQNLMDQYNRTKILPMINKAVADYLESSEKYNNNFDQYKNTTRYSSPDQMITLIDETLETAKTMSQTVKDEQNILDTVVLSLEQYQSSRPIPIAIIQYQSDISGYIGELNGHITSLINIQNSITSNKQSLASSQRSLDTARQNTPLDLASQQNTVKQRQAALQDVRDNLADYYIRAPFSGIVATVHIKKDDSVSTGTSAAVMIAEQKIAEVSLNEVDVAQVKIGQKATLTFDAIENLTITGKVLEIDTLGTVSQGVVTYGVKIGFDTQDEQVKPGMSVSAAVITDAKQNVLMIPNSAVKFAGNTSYVEVPGDVSSVNQLLANAANSTGIALDAPPQQKTVEIGVANDSFTEVIGGLQEGDVVITRTVTAASSTQTTTQSNSLFPVGGTRSNTGGGGFRMQMR